MWVDKVVKQNRRERDNMQFEFHEAHIFIEVGSIKEGGVVRAMITAQKLDNG
jgi:hypothetical protein